MQICINRQGRNEGPYGSQDIVAMLRSGELSADDEIWLEDSRTFIPVSSLLQVLESDGAGDNLDSVVERLEAFQTRLQKASRNSLKSTSFDLLPGWGTLFGLSGGGILAVVCVVAYVWGTIEVNRSGARQREYDQLRERIVTYVDAHPELGVVEWSELRQAGVVGPDDDELLSYLKAAYHPVSADSPDDALMFLRARRNGETREYKGLRSDYITWWPSPDGRFRLQRSPSAAGAGDSVLRLQDVATGQVLIEEPVASVSDAKWREDSLVVVINQSSHDQPERPLLWQINARGARQLSLPAEVEPEQLLRKADAVKPLQWYTNQVRAGHWNSDRTLAIETFGGAWRLNGGARTNSSLAVRCPFVLKVSNDGIVSVVSRGEVKHYHTNRE